MRPRTYVSIIPETSRIGPGIRSALGGAERDAERAGRSMGGRMSSAMGAALKGGAAAAGAAAVAGIGATLTKGFQRLDAIDQARAKLGALGNSGQEVDSIMKNALASVKGTAFGLGDAAGLAGTMVAAGIKPGRELESVLKTVADSAAIAGTDLNDMGQIFGKVAAKGKLDGEALDQLMERQIGILPELAKHYGVTTEAAAKMVSDGKVSFTDFAKVMNEKVGGGALKMGETVRGAFQNMGAAAGRLGAAALEPFFKKLPGGFNGIADAIDGVTPKVAELAESLASKVFDEWPEKIRGGIDALRETGVIDRTKQVFEGVKSAVAEIGPSLAQMVVSLGQASAAVGVGTWQIFLTTLQAGTAVLNMLNPALSAIADLMEAHPGLVMAAVAAWMAFKTVPAMMTRVGTATNALQGRVAGARDAVRGFGDQMRLQQRLAQMNGQEIGRMGAAMAVVRTRASGMGSAMMGAVGGPVGLAVTGLTVGFTMMAAQLQDNKQKAEAYDSASKKLAETQRDLGDALRASRGAMNDEAWAKAGESIDAYKGKVEALADTHQSNWEKTKAGGVIPQFALGRAILETTGIMDKQVTKSNEAANAAISTGQAIERLGQSTEQTSRQVYGSSAEWETLRARLSRMGEGGQQAAADLGKLRAEWERQRDIARTVAPGVSELADAMKVMGDKASSAADKTKALTAALDAMNPARSKGDALARHAEVMDRITEATKEAIDQTKGFGASLLDSDTAINTRTANGRALRESILEIVDASKSAAENGAYTAEVQQQNANKLKDLARQYGLTVDQITTAANALGMDDLDLVMRLSGEDDVTQKLAAISMKWQQIPGKKTITVEADTVTDETRAKLTAMGIQVSKPMNGMVTLTANTEAARQKVLAFTKQFEGLPSHKPITIDTPGGQQVFDLLKSINANVTSDNDKHIVVQAPLAPGVEEQLRRIGFEVVNNNGKNIIVKADDSDYRGKRREWTETVYKQIIAQGVGFGDAVPGGGVLRGPGIALNADGAIRYLNGGIAAAEAFANGGLKRIEKPTRADIFAGRGEGTIFAEKETGGEAYIPLAMSKRSRSTDILATVAKMFGLSLVPQDSISGTLGAIAGGAVTKLLTAAGADRLNRFADGGITAADLKQRIQPLNGRSYGWGAWPTWDTDCSGAQSIGRNLATTGEPFGGGRFATASQQASLLASGYKMGRAPAGIPAIEHGWYNGGPGGGHTAGTIVDPSGGNLNFEMGGSGGGGRVGGGAAGSRDGQFSNIAWRALANPAPAPAPTDPPATETTPDTTTTPSAPSPEPESLADTISGRFGQAASAAVAGQVSDILGVFGINDSPALLGAANQFDQARREREQKNQQPETTPSKPADPGVHKPKEGEDLGVGKALSGVEAIKAAVQKAFAPAGWDKGAPWSATDWIVNKESKWDPKAQNPSSTAYGLFQFLDDTWATVGATKTDDPFKQGEAGRKYIEQRYQTPEKAKAFWQANNWYDQGGVAAGVGHMLKNTLKPERVLSPKQTEAFEQGMKRGFGADAETTGLLRELVGLMRDRRGGGDVNIHNPVYRNESEAVRAQRDFVSRQLMRTGG